MQSLAHGAAPDRNLTVLCNLLAQKQTRPTAGPIAVVCWTLLQQNRQPVQGQAQLCRRTTAALLIGQTLSQRLSLAVGKLPLPVVNGLSDHAEPLCHGCNGFAV